MARMRFVLAVAAVLALSATKGGWSQEPAETAQGAALSYTLQCRVSLEEDEELEQQAALEIPALTIQEGQSANFSDLKTSAFIVGLTPVTGDFGTAFQPVLLGLDKGWRVTATIQNLSEQWVSLDITVEYMQLGDCGTQSVPINGDPVTLQTPTQKTRSMRLIRTAELDQSFQVEADLGDLQASIDLVVSRAEAAVETQESGGLIMGGVTPRIIIQEEEEDLLF